jgi:hypothetical protein
VTQLLGGRIFSPNRDNPRACSVEIQNTGLASRPQPESSDQLEGASIAMHNPKEYQRRATMMHKSFLMIRNLI